MADLPRVAVWRDGIYQLETSDPVMAGPGGIDNRQATELGDCTLWLKTEIENRRILGGHYEIDGSGLTAGNKWSLEGSEHNSPEFTLVNNNTVQVPLGLYRVEFYVVVTTTDVANPQLAKLGLRFGPVTLRQYAGVRYSATATDPIVVHGIDHFNCNDLTAGENEISLEVVSAGTFARLVGLNGATLLVTRIGPHVP